MARWQRAFSYPGILAAFAVFAGGCATTNSADDDEADEYVISTGRNETLPTVSYGPTAEANYLKGEKAFDDGDHLSAQRYFAYVKRKFPYSRFSVLSELRIGDCQVERDRHIEAIDTFQNFVRMHPTHPKVPEAMYKASVSYHQQIPSDFFLLPPSEEKDQTAVRDAERALQQYIGRFPKHERVAAARKLLLQVRRRLMAHERYAADFYDGQGRIRAYVGRLEVIRTKFPDVGLTEDLLMEIVEAHVEIGNEAKAVSALKELEKSFPKSDKLEEARELVKSASAPANKPPDKPAKKPASKVANSPS